MTDYEPQYSLEDLPVDVIESLFNEAKFHLNQAVRFLCRAADKADDYGYSKPIDDLVQKLDDDFSYEMDQVLKKYQKL